MPRNASAVQPRVGCAEFHDLAHGASTGPVRSWWPTIAVSLSPFLVQLPQVMSVKKAPGKAVPSGREPVNISCRFGFSPRPATSSPFSFRMVCFVRLLCSECRSATSFAIFSPLALNHGPEPMRSRACIAGSFSFSA